MTKRLKDSQRKYRYLDILRKPIKENPNKGYKLKYGCPECGDRNSNDQVKLGIGFRECQVCLRAGIPKKDCTYLTAETPDTYQGDE
jgi:hypothetical protein